MGNGGVVLRDPISIETVLQVRTSVVALLDNIDCHLQ